MAPAPGDPGRMPSCCWTGESVGAPSVEILFLVRLLGLGEGGPRVSGKYAALV